MKEESMNDSHLKLVDGTSALLPVEQLETELAKDRWDARKIPGLRYAPHTDSHYVKFVNVPEVFRPLVKDYVKFLLAAGQAAKTLDACACQLGHFFTFFLKRYPDAHTLHDLTVQDIDTFITHLRAEAHLHAQKGSEMHIWRHVHHLEGLLNHLERVQSQSKPNEPTVRLIWPHHYPRLNFAISEQRVKYIPQVVLKQLDSHLRHLPPAYIPIVIILRASGWRISDVLYLKWDTCLEQDGGKYCLIGDIQKTRILGHRIPITAEVAAVVLTQIEWVKNHYLPEENPKKWLFPTPKDKGGHSTQRFLYRDPLVERNV